tara:strand:+ start:1985 stop:2683 length:699 start_codon:yes stop_codon:yes gene_type:complete
MDIVILCGGRGSRLSELTGKTPKPLIKVNGIPMIKYILDQIDYKFFKNVYICTGYKSIQFDNYLRKLSFNHINLIISKGDWRWDTGRRLNEIKNKLNKNFLVLYGDNYVDMQINDYLQLSGQLKNNFVFLLQDKKICADGDGNVDINFEKKIVKHYSQKRLKKYRYCELGYLKLNKKIFQYFDSLNKNESLPSILEKLSLNEKINYIITKNKFIAITDIKKLKKANQFFQML